MRPLVRWRPVRRGTTQSLPASGSHGAADAPFAGRLDARIRTNATQDERQSSSNASLQIKDNSCDAVVSFIVIGNKISVE